MRIACVQLRAREVEDSTRALEEALGAADEAAAAADLVVLPEATYPGYILHEAGPHLDPERYERARRAFAEVALRRASWLVVGLVRPGEGGLANSAVLLDPQGRVAAATDKAFLWHFDRRWFRAGRPGEVLALPWGLTGMFVCADARMTEVPRRLALAGARLLLDPTALVLSPTGRNAQLEYMLSARAWENGVFLAVADKCGTEAGIARYGGRSAIFGPTGERLVEAGAEEPAIIYADLALEEAPGPPVAPDPAGYPEVSAPLETLPITQVLAEGPPAASLRIAMVRAETRTDTILPELDAQLAIGRSLSPAPAVLSAEPNGFRVGQMQHGSGDVVDCGELKVGLLTGHRGAVPEEVRRLMLRGASLMVWDMAGVQIPSEVVRTRADENRVFLVTLQEEDGWALHAPNGALEGSGPHPGLDAVFVDLPLALAWRKEMAPGTDVVRHRPTEV